MRTFARSVRIGRVVGVFLCVAWLVGCGGGGPEGNDYVEYDGTTLIVSGKLAEGCSAQSYLALLDHPAYAAGAVRAIWQELGGTIQGRDIQAPVPKDAKVLARAFSPPYSPLPSCFSSPSLISGSRSSRV